jgi:lipid-A-disaccharide synthase
VAPSLDAHWVEKMIPQCYAGRGTVRAVTRATHDALRHCEVAVVASGTATLDAALRECPMVVVYRVAPFSWLFGKLMVNVPFYSMVNILAKKLVVPELMQSDFTAANVATQVEYLLDHPEARAEMVKEFRALKPRLGPGGAIQRAADAVTSMLQPSETTMKVH